ncbi:hypothetical protein [Neobacillus sp. Marseille-QA0830]
MDIEVFIGDLNDPEFNYQNGNWTGNIPKRISDFFPEPHSIFFNIIKKIDNKEITGWQTDWGSWTAILFPSEMTEFIIDLYGKKATEQNKKVQRLLTFVRQLDAEKQYGIVACEMS